MPPEVVAEAGTATAHPATQAGESVEPDTPPTGRLFFQIGVLLAVIVGALVGLWQFFKVDTAAEVYRKELSVPNPELDELIARDEGRLTQYELLDEKGVYQIPVRRAMELILEDPARLAPVAAPAVAKPAAAPQPAAAPRPAPARAGGSPLLDPAPAGEGE